LAIGLSTAGRLGYLIYPLNLLVWRWLLLSDPGTAREQEPALRTRVTVPGPATHDAVKR
jgi:hypothetical protein